MSNPENKAPDPATADEGDNVFGLLDAKGRQQGQSWSLWSVTIDEHLRRRIDVPDSTELGARWWKACSYGTRDGIRFGPMLGARMFATEGAARAYLVKRLKQATQRAEKRAKPAAAMPQGVRA